MIFVLPLMSGKKENRIGSKRHSNASVSRSICWNFCFPGLPWWITRGVPKSACYPLLIYPVEVFQSGPRAARRRLYLKQNLGEHIQHWILTTISSSGYLLFWCSISRLHQKKTSINTPFQFDGVAWDGSALMPSSLLNFVHESDLICPLERAVNLSLSKCFHDSPNVQLESLEQDVLHFCNMKSTHRLEDWKRHFSRTSTSKYTFTTNISEATQLTFAVNFGFGKILDGVISNIEVEIAGQWSCLREKNCHGIKAFITF